MEVGLAHTVLGARESRVQGEGAGQSETGLGQHWPYTRRRVKVSTQLVQIAKKAQLDRKVRFTSLAHLLTPEFLKETWKAINRQGAGGVDGESIEQFESELEQRIQEICAQLRAGVIGPHQFGGSRYPRDRERPERDRWEFPLSRTACFRRRWRAFSRRSLKRTSVTSAMDIGQDEALIMRCVRYGMQIGSGRSTTCLKPISADFQSC